MLLNNTVGSQNIALGYRAGANVTSGVKNINIGNDGANESNTIRLGANAGHTRTFIAGIKDVVINLGDPVYINSAGQLGSVLSSQRYKADIKQMDNASEAIFALKPVTFRYKQEFDPKGVPQFGLVAEEVAKVNPDLVVPDAEGKPRSVRYEAVNAMLLNEFLKQHRKMQEQAATLADLRSTVARQEVTNRFAIRCTRMAITMIAAIVTREVISITDDLLVRRSFHRQSFFIAQLWRSTRRVYGLAGDFKEP